jgi:hypothetical protein
MARIGLHGHVLFAFLSIQPLRIGIRVANDIGPEAVVAVFVLVTLS